MLPMDNGKKKCKSVSTAFLFINLRVSIAWLFGKIKLKTRVLSETNISNIKLNQSDSYTVWKTLILL